MKKINILVIPPDKHGVGKYRMIDPYTYIGENFSDEFKIDFDFEPKNDDNYFKNYDIVIFHSFIHKTNHENNIERIKFLKNNGIIVINDIDDYWELSTKHPSYLEYVKKNKTKQRIEFIKLSDYVTCTTKTLRDNIITKLNKKNVFIFPNAINENDEQFKPNLIKSDKIRFGWLGGSSHLEDIQILSSTIPQLYNEFKNLQIVYSGFDTRGKVKYLDKITNETKVRDMYPYETNSFKYELIFSDNYKHIDLDYKNFLLKFVRDEENKYHDKSYVRRWTENINNYGFNYNHFDVTLIPLVDNKFNNNKSQLKIIESGFHKKPVICSQVLPYTEDLINFDGNNGNSLLVPTNKNHKMWYKNVKKLIDNPSLINDLGEKLYETVKDKFSLKNVTNDRIEFLKTLIK